MVIALWAGGRQIETDWGYLSHIALVHQGTGASYHRGGAEAARVAHNHEDIRSKRISGIHFNSPTLKKLVVKLDVKRSNFGKPPPRRT